MSCDTLPAAGQDLRVSAMANVYHALVRALAPPTDWPGDFPTQLRDGLSPLAGEVADRAGTLADEAKAAMERLESAAVAHARLFVGPFEVRAAPWASLYLDPQQQLMGQASQYAA